MRGQRFLKTAFSWGVFFYSIAVQAGTFVGNGGDVVVCRHSISQEITSAEVLDLYEGRVHYGLRPQALRGLSVEETLQFFFHRTYKYGLHIPGSGKDLEHFYNQANFLKGTVLVDMPDSWHLSFPKNCKVEQIVIQINPSRKFEKRYTVNQDLWDYLDNFNKAALVFHELLYKHKIEKTDDASKINSRDVRYMVAVTASNKVKEAFESAADYLDFLTQDLWIDDPDKEKTRWSTRLRH